MASSSSQQQQQSYSCAFNRSGSQSPRGAPISDTERLRWSQSKFTVSRGGPDSNSPTAPIRSGSTHNPHIVGYVGHLPTAMERYGQTFQATDIAITADRKEWTTQRLVDHQLRSTIGKRNQEQGHSTAAAAGVGEVEEQEKDFETKEQHHAFNPRCPPLRREGNKSNNHSFRMS